MPKSETQPTIQQFAWFEGGFVPLEEAKIGVQTHGFLYGTSIFEGIRGYYLPESNSVSIFRMREHYERMIGNSRLFYLDDSGYDCEAMCKITTELIERNSPTGDVYIRPTLYKSNLNITPHLGQTTTALTVWTIPFGNYLDLGKGLKVCVSSWRRLRDNAIPPRAKAGGAYMNTALAVTDARKMGFDDAVFLTEGGTVSEGSAMNLFLIHKGKLITPGHTENILEGITRASLMEIARKELGIETVERVVDRSELYFAEEAFFCGTGAQVAPITSFDNRLVGDGNVGPITKKLQDLYFKIVKNQMSAYASWCTVVPIKKESPVK